MNEVGSEDLLALRGRDVEGILRIALFVVFILMAHFGINYIQVYFMEVAGQKVMHDLRMEVFSHLQTFSFSFFDRNPVGRLVTRLTNDIQNVHEMFTSCFVYLLKDILLLVGIIVFLCQFTLEFAFVSFSVLPFIFLTTLIFSHKARDAFREVRQKIAQMNATFQENFSGIRIVQIFQREKENARRFRKINEGHYLANMRQISVYALLDHEESVSIPITPKREEIKGEIEFRNVSFSYNGEDRVLKDVSFSVRKGETVANEGATGARKTSLFNLLLRFYEWKEGSILVDGIDIRERDLSHLRSRIGLVMQDTFLFAGDIEENIRLGKRAMDGQRMREVARWVNAEKFIQPLPEGYRTKVGEGAEQLSAGERQLLAFARALYINPKVLLLDEATSHVAPEKERLVQEGLVRLLQGRASLALAHRLTTIQHADRIIVLHKGSV